MHHIVTTHTQQNTYWSGVFAMSLCAFALIASEFMPVSLLTPIAQDLRISEGQAGWGIGISGIFAVLTSLLITPLAGSLCRKKMLLGMTALMALSGAVVALAQTYMVYMIGRALIGVVVGGFWSMSVAVAMRLVPVADIPRAMAVFNGGNALATVLAAPLGSYLGLVIGWRGAFWCLAPIALAVFVWQWVSLPAMPAPARRDHSRNVFTLLAQRRVALGMLAVGCFFMGQFALFTYVRPFLESVTQVEGATLSLVLLLIGAAGVVGNVLIGRVLQRSLYGALIVIPLSMAALTLGLTVWGDVLAIVALLLGVWGLIATAAPVGWWSWLAQTLPNNAETGGALMVAVIQLCIGFGSFAGGLLFDGMGYRSTFLTSGALLVLAAVLAWRTARATH